MTVETAPWPDRRRTPPQAVTAAIPAIDLAQAWRELERLRREGWYPALRWETDHGWIWTATWRDGRRFGRTVSSSSRDPVEALEGLIRAVEAAGA